MRESLNVTDSKVTLYRTVRLPHFVDAIPLTPPDHNTLSLAADNAYSRSRIYAENHVSIYNHNLSRSISTNDHLRTQTILDFSRFAVLTMEHHFVLSLPR